MDLDKREDERGFYARAWCKDEFEGHGLDAAFIQTNTSFTCKAGTVRGLHYQEHPYAETKLMRCIRGAIHDVIIDLRPESPTYRRWEGFDLTADNRKALYVPKGFANGFVAVEDDTEVLYSVTESYQPQYERGIRYDDPAFDIRWPVEIAVVSEKDRSWPDYSSV